MSAPLAISAPSCVGCGYVGEGGISRLVELAREAAEAEPLGNADCPHLHRPFWYIRRSVRAGALVVAFRLIEADKAPYRPWPRRACVGVEVDFLVFEASPQPLGPLGHRPSQKPSQPAS